MRRSVKVKTYTRKTKSGKTVVVREHMANRECGSGCSGGGEEYKARSKKRVTTKGRKLTDEEKAQRLADLPDDMPVTPEMCRPTPNRNSKYGLRRGDKRAARDLIESEHPYNQDYTHVGKIRSKKRGLRKGDKRAVSDLVESERSRDYTYMVKTPRVKSKKRSTSKSVMANDYEPPRVHSRVVSKRRKRTKPESAMSDEWEPPMTRAPRAASKKRHLNKLGLESHKR